MGAKAFQLTVAEYFAGVGLMRMGLERCGWRVVWANDVSEQKFRMYKAFFSDAGRIYVVADVFQVDPESVPETALATCSFPCVNLSVAGRMEGINGRHSSAFWGFINILERQSRKGRHPPLVLVENVPGWLYSNKGRDFRLTVEALNRLGYMCDVFAVNALSFRPQSRLRVFLVGMREDVFGGPDDPRFYFERVRRRSRLLAPLTLRRSVQACLDLSWKHLPVPAPPPLKTSGLAEIVEPLPESHPLWWPEEEVERHMKMMSEEHRRRVEELARREEYSYRAFFRRMRGGEQRVEVRKDEVAGCLRTAVGGSAQQFLLRAGKGTIRMRRMTPREYARLQGVPDDLPIPERVGRVQALTGFGDAVCVDVVEWIAKNVLAPVALQIAAEPWASAAAYDGAAAPDGPPLQTC